MRRAIIGIGIGLGALIVILVAAIGYAVFNLNSIVASNRAYLLGKVSDSLGRPVQAGDIKVSLGWGITLDVTAVKVADDPAFSQLPFVSANEVLASVEFMPLLTSRELKLTKIDMKNPQVRLIRDRAGIVNASTLGKKVGASAAGAEVAPRGGAPTAPLSSAAPAGTRAQAAGGGKTLNTLEIRSLKIENGQVYYQDLASNAPPLEIHALNLTVDNFSPAAPFDLAMDLAAFGEQKNLEASGKIGPLFQTGVMDLNRAPLALELKVGPILLDKLRSVAPLRDKIPPKLSMPDPITLQGTINGNLQALGFALSADFKNARVVWLGAFNKPAGTALALAVSGSRNGNQLNVSDAVLKLADLQLKATQVEIKDGMLKARIDTNRFALAPVSAMVAALAKYSAAGTAEVHSNVELANGKPVIDGSLVLVQARVKPPGKIPELRDINSTIKLTGNGASLEPTTFSAGSSHGNIEAHAESLEPLRATFVVKADAVKINEFVADRPKDRVEELHDVTGSGAVSGAMAAPEFSALRLKTGFVMGSGRGQLEASADALKPLRATYKISADSLKVAEFVAGRPPTEELREVAVNGSAAGALNDPAIKAMLNSGSGNLADIPYRNLALDADYGGKRAVVRSLKLDAYGGNLAASADATLGAVPVFSLVLNTQNIDLQQALKSQQAKAADTIRGQLTGQFRVSGQGAKFEEIKPTLRGEGKMSIANGKLIGVNVAAQAINKVNGIPGIDTLFTPAVITRHPTLFSDPDTDLKTAALSFTLQGPRLTTHDLDVTSTDYRLLGDGWFDMDKNIALSAHLLMSKQFSDDLRAEKKNVVYIVDQQGQIDIPFKISGALPKPSIQPDVGFLAQRAAGHAIQKQGGKLVEKFLEKKGLGGLGGLLGGGEGPGASGGSAPPPAPGSKPAEPQATPANPLAPFEKLFR